MRKWILTTILLAMFSTQVVATGWTCNLTDHQQEILHVAYQTGAPYNHSYTMIAIAMQESRLGVWNVALGENSFSPWHVRIMHVLADKEWPDTQFHRNMSAQLLLNDDWYAADMALTVFRWWHDYHNGNYRKAWAGYNAGFTGAGASYADKIAAHIRHIQSCGWTNNNERRIDANL